MKKVFAIALFTIVATACSKKESTYQQDSNTMLEEPAVTVVDSAAVTKPADQATVATPATGDSAAAKVDSAK